MKNDSWGPQVYDLIFIDMAPILSFGFKNDNSQVAWWERTMVSLGQCVQSQNRMQYFVSLAVWIKYA